MSVADDTLQSDIHDSAESLEYMYVAQSLPLPDDMGEITNLTPFGDKLLFTANSNNTAIVKNTHETAVTSDIYSIEPDGGNLSKLHNYAHSTDVPADSFGAAIIDDISVDNDGNLLVVESWNLYRYILPPDINSDNVNLWEYQESYSSGCCIRKLDGSGAELSVLDVSKIVDKYENTSIKRIIADIAGNIYVMAQGWDASWSVGGPFITVFDSVGSYLFQIDLTVSPQLLAIMSDGCVSFATQTTDGNGSTSDVLKKINFEAEALGEIINLPVNGLTYFQGNDSYDVIGIDAGYIYGYTEDKGLVNLLNWAESGILAREVYNISNVAIMPDERIICTLGAHNDITDAWNSEIIVFTKTPYSSLPPITEITLATLGAEQRLRDEVVIFNSTNSEYRIRIVDYWDAGAEDGWNAGMARLIIDLNAGKIPDIIDMSGLDFKQFAAKGLLADIYPLIDSDPQHHRNDFVESTFRAAQVDGCLYQVFPEFAINTIVGHPSVVGLGIGWSMDEFLNVLGAHPEADMPLGAWLTKLTFLQAAVSNNIDEYIDWSAGVVHFESDSFVKLLEFCNTLPDDIYYNDIYMCRRIR